MKENEKEKIERRSKLVKLFMVDTQLQPQNVPASDGFTYDPINWIIWNADLLEI